MEKFNSLVVLKEFFVLKIIILTCFLSLFDIWLLVNNGISSLEEICQGKGWKSGRRWRWGGRLEIVQVSTQPKNVFSLVWNSLFTFIYGCSLKKERKEIPTKQKLIQGKNVHCQCVWFIFAIEKKKKKQKSKSAAKKAAPTSPEPSFSSIPKKNEIKLKAKPGKKEQDEDIDKLVEEIEGTSNNNQEKVLLSFYVLIKLYFHIFIVNFIS